MWTEELKAIAGISVNKNQREILVNGLNCYERRLKERRRKSKEDPFFHAEHLEETLEEISIVRSKLTRLRFRGKGTNTIVEDRI